MKNESERLADQLKRAVDGQAWHGPSLKEALEGVTAAHAVAKPIPGAHSIWELVAHIGAWEGVVARRLNGEAVAEPPEDFPAPPANAADAEWQTLLKRSYETHAALVEQISKLSAEDLTRRVDEKPYPAWFMSHGAVAHVLYHVGQIVLLKRLCTT